MNARAASSAGRRRRRAGASLLIVGAVAAVVWIISRWCSVSYSGSAWSVNIAGGCVHSTWDWTNNRWASGWHMADRADIEPKFEYWYGFDGRRTRTPNSIYCFGLARYWPIPGVFKVVSIAWWPLPLLVGGAGVVLVRSAALARRRAGDVCKGCGYSLAGLPEGASCPECGEISRKRAIGRSEAGAT